MDAEDLAQEVYLRLLRVEDLDAIEQPQAYLYRMARNIAAEWRARASEVHPLHPKPMSALTYCFLWDLNSPWQSFHNFG